MSNQSEEMLDEVGNYMQAFTTATAAGVGGYGGAVLGTAVGTLVESTPIIGGFLSITAGALCIMTGVVGAAVIVTMLLQQD